jgi:hypothetical protein
MPQQEKFLEIQAPDGATVSVVKTYDRSFATEVFKELDEEAKEILWRALRIEEIYDPSGLPAPGETEDRDALLLDEMLDEGRDVYPLFSYFVVARELDGKTEHSYVSPDWPSAEEYVKTHFPLSSLPATRPTGSITPNGPGS